MLLWITFAALTAIVLTFLLFPVMRQKVELSPRSSFDLNIYRDQLDELQRDEAAGLIAAPEAESARNEIARRMLLVEADAPFKTKTSQSKTLALVGAVVIPIIAIGGYLSIGNPEYRDVPRAARLASATAAKDFPALIAQVEAHLAANPKDLQGWQVLAPAYRRQGRFSDAADALARAIKLADPSASLYTDFGENLVLANNGSITADARRAFDDALKVDRTFVKARYYRARSYAQDGDRAAALDEFNALLVNAPSDAPWRAPVEAQIAALQATSNAPGPDKEQVEAAQSMSADERSQMIRGMVNQLADRLAENGDDLDGWLRLINAHTVLGDKKEASVALQTARKQFSGNEDAMAKISAIADRLSLK